MERLPERLPGGQAQTGCKVVSGSLAGSAATRPERPRKRTPRIRRAPRMVVPARRYRPAAFEAKACSAQVLMFGAIKPPTAPIEFTRAIPPAAAAPAR